MSVRATVTHARGAVERCLAILCFVLLAIGMGPAGAQSVGAVSISVEDEPYVVFRQTGSGWERQVPLRLSSGRTDTVDGFARVTIGGRTIECPLEPIPTGESHDVIWVPNANSAAKVDVEIVHGGKAIARQGLELPLVPPDRVVSVPRSPILKQLPALSVRGANYLPRMCPWPGLYRQASTLTFEDDFALLRTFSINTIRTFVFFDPDSDQGTFGLYRKDGSATTRVQKQVADLLAAADRYHIKVILNAGALPPLEDIPAARRMFKTVLGPFAHDGRILVFDVMNEPGGADGPKASKTLSTWLQRMYDYSRKMLPDHLLTVGLTWQFDQLWDLGIRPDVGQYHDYSGAVGLQPRGQAPVRNVAGDLARTKAFIGDRPFIIGEFGHSTTTEDSRGVTERRQLEIYRGIFEGAEDQKIAGVLNWTVFDFVPDWMGKFDQKFGIVRVDGSLKPAGYLLRSTYRRWASTHPAPWDPPAVTGSSTR